MAFHSCLNPSLGCSLPDTSGRGRTLPILPLRLIRPASGRYWRPVACSSKAFCPYALSGGSAMSGLLQDLRQAVRQFRLSPGFAALAVITLALAIGANTAMFTVAEDVLLRPLPYADAGRLVVINATNDASAHRHLVAELPRYPRPDHAFLLPGGHLLGRCRRRREQCHGVGACICGRPKQSRAMSRHLGRVAKRQPKSLLHAWRAAAARPHLHRAGGRSERPQGRSAFRGAVARGLSRQSQPSSARPSG